MDEAEWLASEQPQKMLSEFVHAGGLFIDRLSHRKLRLFACACVRQSWHLLDTESRRVVETAERFADGLATKEETFRLASGCMTIARCLMPTWDVTEEAAMVIEMAQMHDRAILPVYAALLRSIAGNPWRPVRLGPEWLGCDCCNGVALDDHGCPCRWSRLATAGSIARQAYDERAQRLATCPRCQGASLGKLLACPNCGNRGRVVVEDGILDPERLLILSDALEEAGCDNEDMLRHLRGWERCQECCGDGMVDRYFPEEDDPYKHVMIPTQVKRRVICDRCHFQRWQPRQGPSVRGDWCLDLILGKQ